MSSWELGQAPFRGLLCSNRLNMMRLQARHTFDFTALEGEQPAHLSTYSQLLTQSNG